MGGFFDKVRKMQCERKNPKTKQNKFWKVIARKQKFWPQLYTIYTGLYLLSLTWGHNGVFNSFIPNVWFSSRVPMVDLIGLLRRRDWNFPDSYLVPYTSLQDGSLACNGASLGQNRSRTSLQDRDPACKRNLWDALRCKIGNPACKIIWIERTTPLEGLWSASDEESYWQTSQTLLLEL